MVLEPPWLSPEQRARKRHARAIKQLGSQSSSIQSLAGEWRKSHGRLQPQRITCSSPSQGKHMLGHQAELRFSGSRASVAVKLPPGLRVSATRNGKLDLRLQLFSVQAEWPSATGPALPDVTPAPSPVLGFACRTGALLLLHMLFSDHTQDVVSALAVPVACWDTAAAVANASPAPVRHAAAKAAARMGRMYTRLERRGEAKGLRLRWLRGTAGTAKAGMHTLHSLSGPAAAVAFGSYGLSVLAPSSHRLLQCMVALMAVSADYNQLGRDAAQGRIAPGKQLEGAWRDCHKRSAARVAHFLGDLPRSPPLGPALDAYARLSIAAAVMCDRGALAGSPCAGTASWAGGNSIGDGTRLAVSASMDLRPRAVKHMDPHTNIERSKLLELFNVSPLVATADTGTVLSPPHTALTAADPHPSAARPAAATSSCTNDATAQHAAGPHTTGHTSPASVYDSASSSPLARQRLWSPFNPAAANPELPLAQAVQQAPHPPAAPTTNGLTTDIVTHGSLSPEDPLAFLHELQLYGRADHGGSTLPSSIADRAALAIRAAYLLMVFSPFLFWGLPLLLLSWNMLRRAAGAEAAATSRAALAAAQAGAVVPRASGLTAAADTSSVQPNSPAMAAMLWLLNCITACVEAVLVLVHHGSRDSGRSAAESTALRMRAAAWKLLLGSMSSAGAAFIKWGQWSATRRDLFPDDLCEMLSTLHDKAPVHSARHSRRSIQQAFGAPPEELFATFSDKPLASGSVAQVHVATLRAGSRGCSGSSGRRSSTDASSGLPVVVKVLHPGVAKRIAQDFRILGPIAEWAGRLKALKGLSLKESVSQFSATMTAQADLRVEAVHAQRFADNFEGVKARMTCPRPVPGFVHSTVLVETFVQGHSVSRYMKEPGPLNTQIVALGVDAYLKMLLKDNFVHTDLHPGNIMVRALPITPLTASGASKTVHSSQQGWQKEQAVEERPQLVFLDFGLAEELTPTVRYRFISFLNFIMAGDGLQAARHLLQWSTRQTCPNRRAFALDMQALFEQRCNIHSPDGIDLDTVLKDVLRLARKHEVAIDSSYASLVIAVCVLVGFAAALDPSVNLADAAAPCLLAYSLTGRIIGRVY